MAKSNSKSIRLSDEVMEYINNYEGNGFNEKFENIILYAMRTEDDRKRRIKSLDCLIQEQEQQLGELQESYRALKYGFYELSKVEQVFENLHIKFDKL